MSKNLGEIINNIMEENSTHKVLILTNHLQIRGTIHDYNEQCENGLIFRRIQLLVLVLLNKKSGYFKNLK